MPLSFGVQFPERWRVKVNRWLEPSLNSGKSISLDGLHVLLISLLTIVCLSRRYCCFTPANIKHCVPIQPILIPTPPSSSDQSDHSAWIRIMSTLKIQVSALRHWAARSVHLLFDIRLRLQVLQISGFSVHFGQWLRTFLSAFASCAKSDWERLPQVHRPILSVATNITYSDCTVVPSSSTNGCEHYL